MELNDYSGPIRPNLRLEDFSKEALIRLIQVYSGLYHALDGFWYLSVKERFSNEDAVACDLWTWEKQRNRGLERLTDVMDIQGSDVSALVKAFQIDPWVWGVDYEIEVKNANNILLTYKECPTLQAFEREGKGREVVHCSVVEQKVLDSFAHYFNPNITVRSVKLPPRRCKADVACQWEFSLENQAAGPLPE
jgi:hypothetical protein